MPFPSPRDLPNLRIESRSPALQADSLLSESSEKPKYSLKVNYSLGPWKKSYARQCIKKQRYPFANKCLDSQSYGFSSSHVRISKLDHKEG